MNVAISHFIIATTHNRNHLLLPPPKKKILITASTHIFVQFGEKKLAVNVTPLRVVIIA